MGEREAGGQPDYESIVNKVIEFLAGKHAIVLATSLEGRVTARTVSMASDGLDVYFMSWGHHTKCAQIRGNPRVALCRDNVQIEGRAEILGSPLDEANGRYAELLQGKYPDYERFAREPGMVIVRVLPSTIALFGRGSGGFYLDCLDLERATVRRKGMADR
jgi:general stress protein 26